MTRRYLAIGFTLAFVWLAGNFATAAAKTLELFMGETQIVKSEGIEHVAVGNPEVADVQIFSGRPDSLLLNAKKAGITTLTIWSQGNAVPDEYEVRVSSESSELEQMVYPLKHYTLARTQYSEAVSRLKIETDEESVASLKAMLSPILGEKRFHVDVPRNRVLMQGNKRDLNSARMMLDEIDRPLRQVLIEAKVIEVTKDDLKRLGASLLAQQGDGAMNSSLSGSDDSFNLAFDTFTDLAKRFSITIDALRSENIGRTLVNPKIATLDGKTAWILAGEKLPVSSRDNDKGLVSFTYVNTGIILAVTPRVGHDRSITLWIKPEVSNVSGWVGDPESSSSNAAPIINSREVMSEVRVADGETVIIGGLNRDDSIEYNSRVPLLGDIPLIGKAFRKKRTSKTTSELVIVITPRILDGPDDAAFAVVKEGAALEKAKTNAVVETELY
jgi:type II secretory pathway component GspD/PulD (secretin)